jgi:putative ABC transport system permease protein
VFGQWSAILSEEDVARRVPALQVSDAFFHVMRARPLLGRLFLPEEQLEGNDQVVVIANDLWKVRFGSNPNVVGTTIRINAQSYMVVGVLPPDFASLPQSLVDGRTEIYRPAAETYNERDRDSRHFRAIARLKLENTVQQAQTQMNAIAARLAQAHPHQNGGYGVRLASMREDLVGAVRPALLLLFAAVCFVLLIACANVANLLLARSGTREREIAVRSALGATHGRLAVQLITESILLSCMGASLGLLIAAAIVAVARTVTSHSFPAIGEITINPAVLVFTMGIAVFAGLAFGLLPALHGARLGLVSSLKATGTTNVSQSHRLRDVLVVTEIALALSLLIGAGLMIRSVHRLSSVDPGFDVSRVVSSDIALPYSKFGRTPATVQFYDHLLNEVQSWPRVQAVGLVSTLPLTDFDTVSFYVEGRPQSLGPRPNADRYIVSPDYLHSMQIALKSGRAFTDADTEAAPLVAMVNETMARQLWRAEDAVGKRIKVPDDADQPWRTVVGIVADVKQYSLDQAPTMQLYLPYRQVPSNYMTLTIRTSVPAATLISSLREKAKAIEADAAFSDPLMLEEILSGSMASRRFTMVTLLGFALLAATLSAVGIYGVLSYLVVHRTREIGVRLALGASPLRISAMVMMRGIGLVGMGLAIGLGLALGASRVLAAMLFEVGPRDALTFVVVPLLLAAVALLACYIPARRAAKVDPIVALRYE